MGLSGGRSETVPEGEGVKMADKWYAVKPGNDDYGSYSFKEADEMLEEQGCGYIAVYDDATNYCEREIHFNDIRG